MRADKKIFLAILNQLDEKRFYLLPVFFVLQEKGSKMPDLLEKE